jgi:hypothetical protein
MGGLLCASGVILLRPLAHVQDQVYGDGLTHGRINARERSAQPRHQRRKAAQRKVGRRGWVAPKQALVDILVIHRRIRTA